MKAWEPPRIMTTDEENYFTRPQIDTLTPDLLALLKRCRPHLEHFESELRGRLGPDRREIFDELDDLLADLDKVGVK